MRNALVSSVMILSLMNGHSQSNQSNPPRGPKPDVGNGRIAWFDITTTNMTQAKEFYSKLFDWKYVALQGTDLAVEIVSDGKSIGTIRRAEGKISPFNGVVYVQVADMVASCQKAKDLGATLVSGFPFNIPGVGAIGLIADPTGHPIGMYSQKLLPEPAK